MTGSTSNDTEFTVEVITDANNIIVNQAHAGGTTSKSLVDETATVTIKLLCKWYLSPDGLGMAPVQVTRASNTQYLNPFPRKMVVKVVLIGQGGTTSEFFDGSVTVGREKRFNGHSADRSTTEIDVTPNGIYQVNQGSCTIDLWVEIR